MSIKSIISKATRFIADVAIVIKNEIVSFVRGVYDHIESISLLVLSSIGATALLSELPFYFALPMWIESPMVIPILAVLLVIGLARIAEWRANHRMQLALVETSNVNNSMNFSGV